MTLTAIEQPGRHTTMDSDGQITGTRTFVIQTTTRQDSFSGVTDLPLQGDAWPGWASLICQDIDATESEQLDGGGWLWTIQLTYRNYWDQEDGSNLGVAPLARVAEWTWESQNFTEARFKDLDGKPYVNPVGDPINPPPVFDVAHIIATVKKNYSSFDGGWAATYCNTVNNAPFSGGATGTVKIDRMTCQPKLQDGVSFFEVTFIFHYNPHGWNPHYELNQGPRYLDADGNLTYVEDDYGVVSTEPVLLNADGTRAITGPAAWGGVFDDAITYTSFRQYDYQNFAALNLL